MQRSNPFHLPKSVPAECGVFCNRTLNLRSIKAIGYDMDYTLIHYNVEAWEGRAYSFIKQGLIKRGWPIEDLEFVEDIVTRGLIIDKELGNVLKANRFGYIKRVYHGTQPLEYKAMRETYSRILVDLSDPRYYFMNTLFSLSEACIYMQLIELLDAGKIPERIGYQDLFDIIRETLDHAHVEGELKREIVTHPERFVELDPELALTLLDQKAAGKTLMLITNSEWEYTQPMMKYAVERYLPEGMKWQDVFDLIIVSARKPDFFSTSSPFFEVLNEQGHLQRSLGPSDESKIYVGGNASAIEEYLGMSGDEILYVGDHIFADVNISKSLLRWRTALIVRELEQEMCEINRTCIQQRSVFELMQQKEELEAEFSALRIASHRKREGYGPQCEESPEAIDEKIKALREQLLALDAQIAPLASSDGRGFNPHWGYLMRTGNDKSHLSIQVERYADIYMSRVSNFLHYTPFVYFRSPRGSLPHDPLLFLYENS